MFCSEADVLCRLAFHPRPAIGAADGELKNRFADFEKSMEDMKSDILNLKDDLQKAVQTTPSAGPTTKSVGPDKAIQETIFSHRRQIKLLEEGFEGLKRDIGKLEPLEKSAEDIKREIVRLTGITKHADARLDAM
jgi:predicted  nucleic acid-binding Zn-ribbon protein